MQTEGLLTLVHFTRFALASCLGGKIFFSQRAKSFVSIQQQQGKTQVCEFDLFEGIMGTM